MASKPLPPDKQKLAAEEAAELDDKLVPTVKPDLEDDEDDEDEEDGGLELDDDDEDEDLVVFTAREAAGALATILGFVKPFLVNYKQELPEYKNDVIATVSATIKHTGLSIVYTSLVLIAGFIIFCGSSFGGTMALGWLTSVTLLVATMTNLVLLPVLLLLTQKKGKGLI